MTAPILYCGDTSLDSAASYLAGLITHAGWNFDYIPSDVELQTENFAERKLIIFSDYPSSKVAEKVQKAIVAAVKGGTGFLMIGGWESFHGMGGNWDGTQIDKILPVEISETDDRVNYAHAAVLGPTAEYQDLWDLPWTRPPCVGGWNDLWPKPRRNAKVMLEIIPMSPYLGHDENGEMCVDWEDASQTYPALVVSEKYAGRVAAFASDVAPHWVGGFVDWGYDRIAAQAPGAAAIEVGEHYAHFWKELLGWTGKLSAKSKL